MDWQLRSVESVSPLWRFHLHYHEYLLDLLASRHVLGDVAERRVWAIVEDWIRENPVDRAGALTDAWHPFCLSKRIAVWLLLWQAAPPPDELQDCFARSLEGQIRYLEDHLEWDLRGNHLLENVRTLVLAGAFFEGSVAERRLERGVRIFGDQLNEQILPSGEHFERSPMYHAQMLSAVLDVRDALRDLRPEFARTCSEVAARMSGFLRTVTHPDGEIALLSDSAISETPPVDVLCQAAEPAGEKRPEQHDLADASRTGVRIAGQVWAFRDRDDYLLFDAGPVGADELPAHAHCDLLGIEASLSGKRLFVDSGVHDYDDGEMRRYCRSTGAHNVLQVDDVEQCDVWSRFRMGYRGRPTSFRSGECDGLLWSRATHDAYRRIGVPVVGRWIASRAGGPWFCIDWAEGNGEHQCVQHLHLGPDAEVTLVSSDMVSLKLGEREVVLQSLSEAPIQINRSWYCPDFGVRQETTVLRIQARAVLPACLGWILHEAVERHRASLAMAAGNLALSWSHDGVARTWSLQQDELRRISHPVKQEPVALWT